MSDNMIERLNAALDDRYRIERQLGEGGMATVYLAEDLKHRRQVAVKVLKPELAAVVGAERFLAEIETTANLQHPHILPLFDSGEADSFLFYVMPYVEDESLRDRVRREQQLPVDEALRIAKGVAGALDYAHRQGVVHRDIKPANILLHEGEPLVADFGIALAVSQAGDGRITETGLSLGTPHYMSPEQAAGERSLEPRSDVYALGCVLYEMLTGEPPYGGPTAQSVLARILTEQPRSVTEIRRSVPRHVDAVVSRALEKLPADRFESAAAFKEALEDESFRHAVVGGSAQIRPATADTKPPGAAGPLPRVPLAAMGGLLLVAVLVAALGWLRPIPEVPVSRLPVRLDPPLIITFGPAFTVSPDGSLLVYRGPGDQLWLRPLASLEATPIPLTEGARTPSFSPDGQSILFHEGQPGDARIRSVSLSGAPPVIVSADAAPGASWGDDGFIYAMGSVGGDAEDEVWRYPVGGGEPELLLSTDSVSYWFPESLPGGRGVLLTRITQGSPSIEVLDLKTRELEPLVSGGRPRFVRGYLFWLNPENTLMAAPFDPEALELTGPSTPVAANILPQPFGSGQYDLSETGTLVYQAGAGELGMEMAVWVERDGDEVPVAPDGWPELAADMDYLALSPDGSHLALDVQAVGGAGEHHIWSYDLAQHTLNRLTVEGGANTAPIWMPDGRTITFSTGGDEDDIYSVPFDGSARPEPVLQGEESFVQLQWAPDGDAFVAQVGDDDGGDLYVGRRDQDELDPLVVSDFYEGGARLSPDGRWVVYVSDQSGQDEVYVRAFPEGGRVWTVSRGGGAAPIWSRDGREIFYANGEPRLISVPISADDGELSLGAREPLFNLSTYEFAAGGRHAVYDIHPDGERLIFIKDPGGEEAEVVVVQGLFQELSGGGDR